MAKGHAKTDSGHISTLKKDKAKRCWMCLKPNDRCTWADFHAILSMLLLIFSLCVGYWACLPLISAQDISPAPNDFCLPWDVCHRGSDSLLLGKRSSCPSLSSFQHNECSLNFSWMKTLSGPGVISYLLLAGGSSSCSRSVQPPPANYINRSRTHQQDGRRTALLSRIVFHLLCKREITVFTDLKLWQAKLKFCFGPILFSFPPFFWMKSFAYFINCHGVILLRASFQV